MALLSAPTFFSPPGFPSFCLSPLSAIFLPLKISVLIAPASCWQFSLWYLDSPLFDSSSGGKGEKTSRCLWVFRWGFPGCPQGLQEHGWGKKKKHFLFSHFCLLQLSVFVYLSICRWLSRQIHPYICLFWHAVRGRGGQCLTGFHLWLDCCQDYRIKTQKKSRPNLMMLLECLTIICLCCAVLSRVQLCWHRLLCPWGFSVHGDSPGKKTGVGCHALLQMIFPTQGLNLGLLHCRQILYHENFSLPEYVTEAQGRAWRITLPLSKWQIDGITVNPKSWIKSLKGLPQSSKNVWTVSLIKLCRLVYLYVKYSKEYSHVNVSLIACTVT